jgi:hypothetical protein
VPAAERPTPGGMRPAASVANPSRATRSICNYLHSTIQVLYPCVFRWCGQTSEVLVYSPVKIVNVVDFGSLMGGQICNDRDRLLCI